MLLALASLTQAASAQVASAQTVTDRTVTDRTVAARAVTATIGDEPPVSGTVQNFIVFDAPVPVSEQPVRTGDGGALRLGDLKGKVVLVNFWATWCGPCIREMPSIEALGQTLAGEDFEIVIVSQDRGGWPLVNTFLQRLAVATPRSTLDEGLKLSRDMQVRGLPLTLILDRDGMEVGRIAGPAEWDEPEAIALVRHYIDRRP